MVNVLVVSDNIDLVTHIIKVSRLLSKGNINFDFSYSIINKSPEKLIELGLKVSDMKDSKSVNNIIERYDLVISAHCKQIFPKILVSSVRCINIHPGFNPSNRGWFPQVFSIINKKDIGCTVHVMDDEVDHGEIIYQQRVVIESWDTSYDVYNKVIQVEKDYITNNLLDLVLEQYNSKKMLEEGNYNSIEDFKSLSKLDLTSVNSLGNHIDLLRALTHGDFNNAFFIDSKGNKVFVKLTLEKASQ